MEAADPAAQRQVFLSPHLDDAALSAGGSIHRLSAGGTAVSILTLCAGRPPEAALSRYALGLHARWGQAPSEASSAATAMVARRRAEDRAACRRLGAAYVHLRLPDLIYRRRANGAWAAESDADLFAGAAGVDEGTVAGLARRLGRWLTRQGRPAFAGAPASGTGEVGHSGSPEPVRLWLPLGIGDHVDHHLCRQAAERLAALHPGSIDLRYYEDYPYAKDVDARAKALESAPPHGRWMERRLPIDPQDLLAKLDAVASFASQISSFWTDEAAMRLALTDHARRAAAPADGWAETFWERST